MAGSPEADPESHPSADSPEADPLAACRSEEHPACLEPHCPEHLGYLGYLEGPWAAASRLARAARYLSAEAGSHPEVAVEYLSAEAGFPQVVAADLPKAAAGSHQARAARYPSAEAGSHPEVVAGYPVRLECPSKGGHLRVEYLSGESHPMAAHPTMPRRRIDRSPCGLPSCRC